jgi:hypothetical protein
MKLIFSILLFFTVIDSCKFAVLDSNENAVNIDLTTFNGVIILRTKKECVGCNIPLDSYLRDSVKIDYNTLTLVNGINLIYGENESLKDILPTSKNNYFEIAVTSDKNYNQTPSKSSIFREYKVSTSPSLIIANEGKVRVFQNNKMFTLDGDLSQDVKAELAKLKN